MIPPPFFRFFFFGPVEDSENLRSLENVAKKETHTAVVESIFLGSTFNWIDGSIDGGFVVSKRSKPLGFPR